MKALIINGSPRKNGNTVTLIEEFKKHYNGEVIEISTYRSDIKPCTDCRYCWKNDGCSIKDDMQQVYDLMNEVDTVILASSLNYSELTGSLLCLASRFQRYYAAKYRRKDESFRLKKKSGYLFLVGGGDSKHPTPAENTARIILLGINAKLLEVVRSPKTDTVPASEDTEALNAVKEIAMRLNDPSQ